jgi:hypothetical protein
VTRIIYRADQGQGPKLSAQSLTLLGGVLNGTLKDVLLAVQPRRTAAASFDHLVGAGEQRRRNIDPERLGGPEVDDKLELGRLLDWNVGCQIKLDQLRFI